MTFPSLFRPVAGEEPQPPRSGAARVRLLAVATLAGLFSFGCLSVPLSDSRPLRVRNQHPVQLTVAHVGPRTPRPLSRGRVAAELGVAWTNLWLRPGDGVDRINLDGEIARADLGLRTGLGGGLDLDVSIPVLHASGGMLDALIEGYHDLFGLPQNDRDDFDRGSFEVEARRAQTGGGIATAYRLEDDGLRLGDIPLFVSWFPWPDSQNGPSLGLRLGVDLPTGDESDGYGNGGLDAALGFISGLDRTGYSLFAWGGYAWVSTPDTADDAGLEYRDTTHFGLGAELGVSERTRLLAQLEFETSVLGDLRESHADPDHLLLWIGFRRPTALGELEVGLAEDLISDVSPDISFHFAIRRRF